MMNHTRKCYTELMRLSTFEERFSYCMLDGGVGSLTFGGHRWLNQELYSSLEWRRIRDSVIIRDEGCDLAMPDRAIFDMIVVHHLNPVTIDDLRNGSPLVFDPEYLICVSDSTHKAIHYGDGRLLMSSTPIIRKPNDTCPWK